MNKSSSREWRPLERLELSLVLAMAAALPWELFQRIPPFEITVVKAAGALLVFVVGLRLVVTRRKPRRTGLEVPMLALLVVLAASTLASEDRRASAGQLGVYATYFVIFCAIGAVVSTAGRARLAAWIFVASSAAVGALALACRAGWATPTLVDATRITGRWTDEAAWFDLTTRMAPASSDFNQGALPLLAAYALALFLLVGRKKGLSRIAAAAALLSLAGVMSTLSRSSMVLAAGLTAAFILHELGQGRRKRAARLAAAAVVAVVALVVLMGPAGVIGRFAQLAGERDSSLESRVAAFEAGWALLPAYWKTGTGPGALDGVIAKSAQGARVGGITVHSVPFKLLLETGVAGLAALVWLYWRALRLHLKGLKTEDEELRRHSRAFLALGATLFLVTLVQPFMTLALFPFVLAIAAGPLAWSGDSGAGRASDESQGPSGVLAIAPALIVGAVVTVNAMSFYQTVDRVRPFVESLVTAALAERAGDFEAAKGAYETADSILKAQHLNHPNETRYYAEAAGVLDASYAYQKMGARHRKLDPAVAVWYGQGRVEAAMGNTVRAVELLRAAGDFEPAFAQAQFTLAEVLWDSGEYAEALERYKKAKELETVRENAEFRQFVAPLDEFIAGSAASSDGAAQLRRAEFLRKRGRWDEAVEVYKQAAERDTACAEALFNLGVQARLEGEEGKALDLFRRALTAAPLHYETLRELVRQKSS